MYSYTTNPSFIIVAAAILTSCASENTNKNSTANSPHNFQLGLPISCNIGKDCGVIGYMDHDESPSTGVDYTCGWATEDDRKESMFAINYYKAMNDGVPVLAAADGVVIGQRNNMDDGDFNNYGMSAVDGKECGNGVLLHHGSGWKTQYCHMRKSSVLVETGDTVSAGEQLGLVGESGYTNFPYLGFQLKKYDQNIDPFSGRKRWSPCGGVSYSFWNEEAQEKLKYQPTFLIDAGFTSEHPNPTVARKGGYSDKKISTHIRKLSLWVDAFRVDAGDRFTFNIFDPDKKTILSAERTVLHRNGREFEHRTIVLNSGGLKPGRYTGVVILNRETSKGTKSFHIQRDILITDGQAGTKLSAIRSPDFKKVD